MKNRKTGRSLVAVGEHNWLFKQFFALCDRPNPGEIALLAFFGMMTEEDTSDWCKYIKSIWGIETD
jgi:hypothetical protein